MNRRALTVADLERGYDDDRWLGWGYLGERRHLDPDELARADALVLRLANEARWDPETFFHWLNSRYGRHFADAVAGRPDLDVEQLRGGYFSRRDFIPPRHAEAGI